MPIVRTGGESADRRGTGHLDWCPFLPVRRTSRTLRRSIDPSQMDIRARRSRPLFRVSSVQLEQPAGGFTSRSTAPGRQRTGVLPSTTTHQLPRTFPTSDRIGIPATPGPDVATAPAPAGYSQLAGTRGAATSSADGPHCADATLAAPQDDPLPKHQVRPAGRLLGVGDLAIVDVRASLGHRPPPR
jgi:hypothetical protein